MGQIGAQISKTLQINKRLNSQNQPQGADERRAMQKAMTPRS
jgi:hypothetical protein